MYVVGENSADAVRTALQEGGVDVDAALKSGTLIIETIDTTYLKTGTFDADEMMERYTDIIEDTTAEYEAFRLVAEMSWILEADVSIKESMEYESKVNALFVRCYSRQRTCRSGRSVLEPQDISSVAGRWRVDFHQESKSSCVPQEETSPTQTGFDAWKVVLSDRLPRTFIEQQLPASMHGGRPVLRRFPAAHAPCPTGRGSRSRSDRRRCSLRTRGYTGRATR